MGVTPIQPPGWPRPSGYADGVAARGTMVFVAGQVGWTREHKFATDDFAGQVRQALENIVAVLAAAGAEPRHLVRLTWYVADRQAYLDRRHEVGAAYQAVIGRHYPAMTLVEVTRLLDDGAQVEIEATAVIPDQV